MLYSTYFSICSRDGSLYIHVNAYHTRPRLIILVRAENFLTANSADGIRLEDNHK